MTTPIETFADSLISSDAPGDRPGKGEPAPGRGCRPTRTAVIVAVLAVAAAGGGIAVVATLSSGPPQTSPSSLPAASTTAPPGTPPTPPPTTAPPRPVLTGTYSGTIDVAPGGDPEGHHNYIGPMPTILDVRATRSRTTGVVTITVTGSPPFITTISTGNYDAATGHFSATGSGTVTSRSIPVTATLDGMLLAGSLSGTLTLTGTPVAPITYTVTMTKSS